MNIRQVVLILSFACVTLLLANTSSAKQYRISSFNHDTTQIDVTYKVMRKVYQRLGHDFELIRYPGKRSLVEANNGQVSGELMRIKALEKTLNNMIRIPVAIGSLKVMAITRKGERKVTGIAGLIGKHVGVVRGVELTERLTKNHQRQIVNSIDSLFKVLLNEHVEVILFPKLDAEKYIAAHQMEGKVNISEASILEVKLYHYIHESRAKLAAELTELLQDMERTGELDALNHLTEQASY